MPVAAAPAVLKPGKRSATAGSRQQTIFGCKKVVVLDDIAELRQTLKSKDSSDSERVAALRKLDLLHMTEKTLRRTRIGKTVNALTSHQAASVRKLARKLIAKWKSIVTAPPPVVIRPPPPPVMSDEARVRGSCRDTLAARLIRAQEEPAAYVADSVECGTFPNDNGDSIVDGSAVQSLAEAGESAIWAAAGNSIGRDHGRVLRLVVQAMDEEPEVTKSILSGSITFKQLVQRVDG